jgi:uncharacterized protein with NAD-binding domain and iron-sulfur cluster
MPAVPTAAKVAVLGGGPAALAAAFELTSQEARDSGHSYEVTVYQPGWRLGGKCASGRNMEAGRGQRIEEHGLHVWFGFYESAFSLMRQTYDELKRPAGHPLRTLDDAFIGCDEIVLYDLQGNDWVDLGFKAAPNPLKPGMPNEALPGFWEIVKWVAEWALRELEELGIDGGGGPPGGHNGGTGNAFGEAPGPTLDEILAGVGPSLAWNAGPLFDPAALLRTVLTLATGAQGKGTSELPRDGLAPLDPIGELFGHSVEQLLASMLGQLRDWLWETFEEELEADARKRLFFTIFDFFASAAIGIVDDEVLKNGWGTINDLDLCEWLCKHGAKQVTVGATPAERSPMLRSIYDVAFGYPDGDIEKANIAAGTAMNDYLRMQFTFRGHLMYKMQAGMGDAVIAPLYELLKKRGVKFKFFHAVEAIRLSPDGRRVCEIDVVNQVGLKVDGYDPLVNVNGLDCWPSTPIWERLKGGRAFEGNAHDFEQEPNPLNLPPTTLQVDADFDAVVLGIPVGALPAICADVSAKQPRFKEMLDNSVTVCTQSFQLWLTESPTALGWTHSENSVAGCYVEPIDTWCDMTHLLAHEAWGPHDGVKGLAYFCGVLAPVPGEKAPEAAARVRANVEVFLQNHVGPLWPHALGAGKAINWNFLADPGRPTLGPARLASQYWRGNVTDSERYVLTPAGSVDHRLGAGGSGVANLVLAGDWTSNGIDGGCVEAAVTSGLQAGRHLSGGQRPSLVGTSPTWLSSPKPGAVAMPPPRPPAGGPPGKPGAPGGGPAPVADPGGEGEP